MAGDSDKDVSHFATQALSVSQYWKDFW